MVKHKHPAPQKNKGAKTAEEPKLDSPFSSLASLKTKLPTLKREENSKPQEPQPFPWPPRQTANPKEKGSKKDPFGDLPFHDEVSQPQTEEDIFKNEMAGVNTLKKPTNRHPLSPPPADSWKVPDLPDENIIALQNLKDLVSGRGEFNLSYTDEYVEGHIKNLSPGILDQLKNGRIPFQDHLDLHGLNLAAASEAINSYILNSVALGRRCVLLIHGRGHRSPGGFPVLKHNLETLLLRPPIKKFILAFTTARPIDGGLGASYILLKG